MPRNKPDLILDASGDDTPPRKVFLDVSQIRPGKLTLLEALDMAEAANVNPDDFTKVLVNGSASRKARLIYAFAWVLARRTEPGLTFAEVCTYDLTVTGSAPTEADHRADAERANAVASVAKLAGVTPREAEQMTMAEVKAVTDLATKRRTRGRRAG